MTATLYRLSASRQRGELLEALFPDGPEQLPRLSKPDDQAYTLDALAHGVSVQRTAGAAPRRYLQASVQHCQKQNDTENLSIGLCNLSDALRLCGRHQPRLKPLPPQALVISP